MSPRREDQQHRFAWVPFGGGAQMHWDAVRHTEVKAILHQMLRTYTGRSQTTITCVGTTPRCPFPWTDCL